ncbi:hypothetical protein BO78DRAFT_321261 [Aspergillus sclerotiicarbonarius CBS 121057]|uniref:Uncharacterized protein n=1 Tax=Aspergillus sclerotiicarbonarius (strain CBS 121057 / IBT 28362) TaxID=1448318 RepID=A0A319EC65_ASPSB|nr:hypothetical protein BO78DRAFT_321261 [Aspergillus sclerotiicarbonarius CBS 121057]
MTAIIQKLRRKQKLSSELHSRWGDVAITYPTGGSWNQWDHSPTGGHSASTDPERRHGSLELNRSATAPRMGSQVRSGARTPSVDSAMTIPTGHYDARSCTDESSEDEEDAAAVPAPLNVSRDRNPTTTEESDAYSRASKSPPLSVTSRMRRYSVQSNSAEPTIPGPGTASSKHTSYTSSTPSNPSEDPRPHGHRLSTQHEKKPARRPKPEPLSLPTQPEMVPSYDELYG